MPQRETRARTGRLGRPGLRATAGLTVAALAVLVLVPAADSAARAALRLAAAMHSIPKKAHPVPASMSEGESFSGTPAVGALFSTTGNGKLGTHFCTASVVHSPHGDLAITAAHCVWHHNGVIDFVPGYHGGNSPYGVWTVTKVIVDQAWSASASPDDDVAFLKLSKPGSGTKIENVTGAERISSGQPASLPVQVIGYPDGEGFPVTCQGQTSVPLPHQLEFDCGKYTNGTSGGPFLFNVDPATGDGTVIGVIGGYQQGGDLPQISYSAAFGQNVATLYRTAVRQS
jgi:V8-like Glu-specific endopeptidase